LGSPFGRSYWVLRRLALILYNCRGVLSTKMMCLTLYYPHAGIKIIILFTGACFFSVPLASCCVFAFPLGRLEQLPLVRKPLGRFASACLFERGECEFIPPFRLEFSWFWWPSVANRLPLSYVRLKRKLSLFLFESSSR